MDECENPSCHRDYTGMIQCADTGEHVRVCEYHGLAWLYDQQDGNGGRRSFAYLN